MAGGGGRGEVQGGGGEAEHQGAGGGGVVGNLAVEDGVLDAFLYDADFAALSEAESGHYLDAVDRGLEVADAVALLEFGHLLSDKLVVSR